MPFFATMPITMISPMNDEMLNVVPVTSSARNTPEVESSAEARIAAGAAKLPNFEQQHREHQHHRQRQHEQQIAERLLLFRVSAAVDHANRRRHVQVAHRLLHRLHAFAEADAFEAAGDGDVALQIFAADFGLAGFVLKCRPASRASRSCRSN